MNIHPPFSSFPIVLFTVSIIFEIIGIYRNKDILISVARANLVAACVFMFAAFFSGYQAAENASISFKIPTEAIQDHHSIGKILLFISIPTAILAVVSKTAKNNSKMFSIAFYIFLITCVSLAIYCGWLGGNLVFKYGAGVSVPL